MSGKSIPKIEGFLATKSLRDDVLNEMADYLAAKGAVKPSYGAAVITRENVFPTGIPCEPIGVAIPHSDRALVEDTTVLVAKLPQGVTFTRIDDGDLTVDVRVVFMLAVNSDQGQLDTIAQVMDLIQNPELVQSVACAQSAEEIQRLVSEAYPD